MTNLLFIGGLFSKENQSEIRKNSKSMPQEAANALQWSFVEGFILNGINLSVLNLPYIGEYPFNYKKIRYKGRGITINNNQSFFDDLSFNNLFILSKFSKYYNLKHKIQQWINMNENNRTVIIYALYLPFIYATVQLKKKYPDLKILVIVPDLPQFMRSNKSLGYRIYELLQNYILFKKIKFIDACVYLSKYMNEYFKFEDNKWLVIEGIYNDSVKLHSKTAQSNKKIFFYAGSLSYRYGIKILLEAFTQINNDDVQLYICGDGEAKQEIIRLSNSDKRIKYLGVLPRDKVLELQQEASLLINPRPNNSEFTKYSFPSKTIEYLASGTPVVLCKLEGIPDEYYKYCFALDNMDSTTLCNALKKICIMPENQLDEIGQSAKQFVFNKKNKKVQCEKIIELIKFLNGNNY